MSDKREPGALFARLAKRSRPYTTFVWPKRDPNEPDEEIVMTLLSDGEIQECAARAQKVADERTREGSDKSSNSGKEGWREIYDDEKIVQILAKSMYEVGYPSEQSMVVPDAKMLRNNLTPDELGVLIRVYHNLRYEVGPIISEVKEAELDGYIKLLMEGGRRVPLSPLSSEALTDLVMHLVARLKTFSSASGAPGSPAESSSTNNSSSSNSENVSGKDLL